MKKPEYYAAGEREILTADCIEDALVEYIEQVDPDAPISPVAIHGYARMQIDPESPLFMQALEGVLERLDDEYANPESDEYIQPTQAMKDALKVFASVIIKEYPVWMCEQCGDPITCAFDYDQESGELKNIAAVVIK